MTISLVADQMPVRTVKGLERVDSMNGDMRRCVHEFGLPIVDTCIQSGVKEPRHIRQLVKEIWAGSRETWKQKQAGHSGLVSKLDWILAQSDGPINAMTLLRILDQHDFVLVPRSPWVSMVTASMETVSGFDVKCTKQEKHSARLRAAVKAAVKHAWPHLDRDR